MAWQKSIETSSKQLIGNFMANDGEWHAWKFKLFRLAGRFVV